jgi:predicted RNA binding protein YcfA (HicA-like mRNA interferase family)
MKAKKLFAILKADLGYEVYSQRGSHRKMRAEGRNNILFSFHDNVEVPPGLVRKLLTSDVGLSEQDAIRVLGMKG